MSNFKTMSNHSTTKFLYGASIHGIQKFIFQTNKLKEIVGASILINELMNELPPGVDGEQIMTAAGHMKYVMDEENCRKMVKEFPKFVMNKAPGVSVSQAVVKINGDLKKANDELGSRIRIQRNRPFMPLETGYMALARSRRTGGVGFKYAQDEVLDSSTYAKIIACKNVEESDPGKGRSGHAWLLKKTMGDGVRVDEVPFDIRFITQSADNSWLAIIHADGNSLGQLVKAIGEKDVTGNKIRDFSKKLKEATGRAAQKAFEAVVKDQKREHAKYPFRPIILGGDDLTVIIRADLAFDYTIEYLKFFEEETSEKVGKKLTACAGIAYIRDHYPFHYGVHLADALTAEAKKMSKSLSPEAPPSSLSFYKVQSSFTESLEDMRDRTHKVKNCGIDFHYGPYLIKPDGEKPSVEVLKRELKVLEEYVKKGKGRGISKLRKWLTLLHENKAKADFFMNRFKEINPDLYGKLDLESQKAGKSYIFDLLQLYSFLQLYGSKA